MKNYADDGFPRYQRTRNDLPGCRMTDRPTEQIHQPEQLTNISFSNLMAVGNILEEYSFVCWAGGRTVRPDLRHSSFSYLFFAVVATLETISETSLQVLCQTEIQNTCHLLLFLSCSQSSRTWKLNSKNRLRSSKQRKKAQWVRKQPACNSSFNCCLREKGACNERNTRRLRAGQ